MSDTVVISLIGSIATVVISMINAGLALLNHERGKQNAENLMQLKEQTNGLQSQLLVATGDAAFAKGVKSEVDKGKESK